MSDNRSDRGNRGAVRAGHRPGAMPYRRPAQQGPQGFRGRRMLPVWMIVVLDVLALGVALNIFALSGTLISPEAPVEQLPNPTVSIAPAPTQTLISTPTADLSSPTATQDNSSPPASQTPSPTQDPDMGMWGKQFAGVFTDGEIISTDDTYKSHDVSITVTKDRKNGIDWIVADIYIRNKENFSAFFHKDKINGGIDSTLDQANERKAILAINGDNAGNRSNRLGYEVRNGTLFRAVPWQDVLVMYNDGSMKTYGKSGFEKEWASIKQNGAWQVWTFGPMLLDDRGNAMTKFAPDSIPGPNNQRTAIGFFEPGHYCFVVVCGASSDNRAGASLADLSQKMYDLGCTVAYNMDGGRSAAMTFNGKNVNTLYEGGRGISDIVCIGETN